MPAQAKFLIGFLGVGLLTWLWLQPLGHSAAIATDLEQRAVEALAAQEAGAVTLTVHDNPVRRAITLDGNVSNDERAQLRDAVMAVSGVSEVTWAQSELADAERTDADGAAQSCHNAVVMAISEERIQFRSGSPYLNPAARRLLDRIADAARDCEGIRIEISGHTNSGGRPNVNNEMAAFRATTVRDALVERGVPAEMLTTIGKGSSEPLGDDPADPANRRVDFTVSVVGEEAG